MGRCTKGAEVNVFNEWSRDVVHGRADVDAGASIGNGSRVWAYASIATGAVIGKNCVIGQAVHIGPKVIVGSGCKIQNGAQLFEGVTLEDDVFIGPHVVFTNVLTPRAFIDRKAEFKPTLVKRGASIGANATIICGVTIGEYAMVGAGSVVTKNVRHHALMVGNPAKETDLVCTCGARMVGLYHTPTETTKTQPCTACARSIVLTFSPLWPYNLTDIEVTDAEVP